MSGRLATKFKYGIFLSESIKMTGQKRSRVRESKGTSNITHVTYREMRYRTSPNIGNVKAMCDAWVF